ETQTSILSLVFRYCDDQHLPLLDLADLRTTLKFLGSDDGKAVLEDLGGISGASLGVILRAIVTIEEEGADIFFGEPEFDVNELRKPARTFPMTEHYDLERTLTSLGIGEALVTVLSPKGVPTPLAATRLIPPDSRMAPLSEAELGQVVAGSQLQARYGTPI